MKPLQEVTNKEIKVTATKDAGSFFIPFDSIEEGWKDALTCETKKPYFTKLNDYVGAQYKAGVCYPPIREVFTAFNLCPLKNVKVVIIGQVNIYYIHTHTSINIIKITKS